MKPITRRCLSCSKYLTLDHYDLAGPKQVRVCNACTEPWPGARLAIQSMYVALGKDIPFMAHALGYTHGTAEAYLYGRERMNTRASHRVRLAYEELRTTDNGIALHDSAEELAEKAKQRARAQSR